MKVCWGDNKGEIILPSSFSKEEINFARSKGVKLDVKYSKTREEHYRANCCSNNKCSDFKGEAFLLVEIQDLV